MAKNTHGSGPETPAGGPFPRPDAERAAQGQPPFEHAPSAHQRDQAHGYSQDSGYAGSGGAPAETGSGHASDEQIRQRVHERLTQQSILAEARLSVSVEDGIVTLEGEVPDEIERGELTELVRTIPEVRHVRSSELKLASKRN